MKSNFIQRIATSAVFVIVLIGSSILHSISFFLLFALLTLLGQIEFYRLAIRSELKPQIFTGIAFGFAIFAGNFLVAARIEEPIIFAIYVPIIILIMVFELFKDMENPFSNIAFTILGALYVAVPFGLISYLVYHPVFNNNYNPSILIAFFLLIWASDSGAYIVGSLIGKHKLFERISPKKTWEGFLGGALFSLLAAYFISLFIDEVYLVHWFAISIITVIFGTFGDLVESLLKRKVNVKDSGSMLPGHGGILDRFDSLLFAAPIVFFYLLVFI